MGSIYLLDLTEDLKPKGEPRPLTPLKSYLLGLAWTPDGRDIIFSFGFMADMSLWKVSAFAAGEPEPLPVTGEYPTISRSGNRLAYQRAVCDTNIWRLSLSAPGVAAGAPSPFISSTRADGAAQYSPDGKRIAFESRRSGPLGIWVSDADGSNAQQLFSRSGKDCGNPNWSPDGQRIAFYSNLEGNIHIYIIRASGGKPVRLTVGSSEDYGPSWSRDGNWVYFASNRTGRLEVWKVPSGGGKEIQVTRNGGETALESPDGKSIYYTKEYPSLGLWKMPLSGGEESQVLPSVLGSDFSLVKEGLFHSWAYLKEVFRPVSELRHRRGENRRSDVSSELWGPFFFAGRPVPPVLAARRRSQRPDVGGEFPVNFGVRELVPALASQSDARH